MTIDWTTVLVAAITGLLSGAAITAVWTGLKARAESRRSDSMAHVEAADALSESSADYVQRTSEQYEARITRYDARLVMLEEKCRAYETAFGTLRGELIQAQQTISLHELTIAQLSRENGELRGRVKHLENENADLRQRLEQMEQGGTS